MDANLDEIAKIVTLAKPIIDPFISTIIQPSIAKLSGLLKRREIKNKLVDNFYENKFADYLSITLNRCESVNLLIFQNHQIKISEIYYPLTLRSSKDSSEHQVLNFPANLFSNAKKILVSDAAGMGKSTLSKWLCKKVIEQNLAIPILIELRNLTDSHNIMSEIFTQFNPIDKDFDKDLLLKFLELGNFLIILDGFDEIQHRNQETIIKDIREFINKANNNWFLLTSRPEGFLSAFGDFLHFNIKPLIGNEPFELIRKYDSIAPIKISENLIRDIQEKYDQVVELLGNPFLVSLLYSTYTFNKDIPSSKLSFYEEIYYALYKKHDLSKDGWTRPKKSNLDIMQFRVVLRQLAFDTTSIGETNYSETKLLELVNAAINKSPGITANAGAFVEDIISTVPLFQRDGLKIKWAHKSIQDFFTSEYIVYDVKKEAFLNAIYEADVDFYNNILEFIIESDFKSFRNTIIKKILIDFIDYYDSSYRNPYFKQFNKKDLDLRISKTFGVNYFLRKSRTLDFHEGFAKLISEFPNIKKYQKNSSITDHGLGVEIYTTIGLKVAIIEMLAKKSMEFIKESSLDVGSKIPLTKGQFYHVCDDDMSIINDRKYFNRVTALLPFGGYVRKFGFPIIDYMAARQELSNIDREISLSNDASGLINLINNHQ